MLVYGYIQQYLEIRKANPFPRPKSFFEQAPPPKI